MTDTNRVKRWRDAKRDRGLKAVTVWLTQEEELRLKDIALQWHCSPSTVMQRALAQVTTNTPPYISSPTDISLIRELIRAELATMQAAQTPVTGTVTVTATSESEAASKGKSAREYVTVPSNSVVTETPPLEPVTDAGNSVVTDTGTTDMPTTLAPAPEMPGPPVQTAPALAEDIMKIAAARVQYDTMSERAFTQLLFDRGIYRHQAKDGSEVPLPHSTLRDWLQRARNAGVLEGRL
jgi:hypothetical protein